ncbi:MAG: DUF6261 family protein [Bacteroidales bacterium]|nr:DUF6261 family protein [Bacteroidales bacterium]
MNHKIIFQLALITALLLTCKDEPAATATSLSVSPETLTFPSGEYAPKVNLLGLTPWVNELREAVADFERLLKLRNTEQAGKPQQRLRDIRRTSSPCRRTPERR